MLDVLFGRALFMKVFRVLLADYAEEKTMPKNCWNFAA
jgi:hypothetical protein